MQSWSSTSFWYIGSPRIISGFDENLSKEASAVGALAMLMKAMLLDYQMIGRNPSVLPS
jgi:hypothetical protein